MSTIIGIIFIILIIYLGLPSLWYRLISRYTLRRVYNQNVAITFDDGPDEVYTNKNT